MSFIQTSFLWFFAVVFTAYWLLGRRRWQNALLLVASYVFYGWVHPWFCALLLFSSIVDFFVGQKMAVSPHKGRWLAVSLTANLGLLAYFKYMDFFLENVAAVLTGLGIGNDVHTLGIFLPVGISFFTFQTLSYTIDIYRGELEPRRDFLDYMVFVSFFPQLVAGPVERASNLLPQMEEDRTLDWQQVRSGLHLALWGGFKKICVADTISPYVNLVFIHTDPSFAMVAAATVGFAVQILADFSGYTDIARGIARMMGFELIENFKHPYLAINPSDFWRRWHVSFSSWIRDYLYIPLGGSRGSGAQTLRATFGSMLLSGLWHGASWNFVIWGAYHAVLITGYRAVERRLPRGLLRQERLKPFTIPVMFVFTCWGWLVFRETHLDRLVHYHTLSPLAGTPDQWLAAAVLLAMVGLVSAPLVLAWIIQDHLDPRLLHSRWLWPLQTTTWAVLIAAMITFARNTDEDFIYFAF